MRGVTLVEMLVALAVLSLTLTATNQFFLNTMRGDREVQARTTRDNIVSFIRNAIANPMVMRVSASIWPALQQCLEAEKPTPKICQAGQVVASPAPGAIANRQEMRICMPQGGADCMDLTGTPSEPVYYNLEGARKVGGASGVFPIKAISHFWVTCPDAAASCDVAETIYISFQVEIDRNVYSSAITAIDFAPYPPAGAYDSAKVKDYAVAVKVTDLNSLESQMAQCQEDNEILVGATRDGAPRCQCAPGFTRADLDGDGVNDECRPRDNNCPESSSFSFGTGSLNGADRQMYPVGLYEDGTVKCAERRFICWIINECDYDENDNRSCNCRRRFGNDPFREVWIRDVNVGECRVTSGKKGGDTVECDDSSSRCCAWVN